MAASTFTASAFALQPKQTHTGNQSRHFTFNSGATAFGTVGDIVMLCKIPNKATVTECWFRFASAAAGSTFAAIVTKGRTSSATTTLAVIASSITASAASLKVDMRTSAANIAPFQISLSDDDAIQYAVLKLQFTTGASATASVSLDGVIVWAMDAEA